MTNVPKGYKLKFIKYNYNKIQSKIIRFTYLLYITNRKIRYILPLSTNVNILMINWNTNTNEVTDFIQSSIIVNIGKIL